MKAMVDEDTCIGCELCADTCSEIFVMDGDKARVKVAVVPVEVELSCRDAMEGCPVDAITIEE